MKPEAAGSASEGGSAATAAARRADGLASAFNSLSPAARMLVVNQFFIMLGFSMVLPFLAIYLAKDLRLAPALVGLIVGLRALSSQGMFLFGGSLGDRIGPRPIIIFGCSLRVVSFGLFAASTALPAIIAATILAGLGTAFFNPAVRKYLTAEAAGHRAEAFGVFNLAGNTGGLLGPVVGGLLLAVDFRLVAFCGALVFAFLTIAQLFFLPSREMDKPEGTVLSNWWDVVRNKRFAAFTLAGAMQSLMATQVSFSMVLEAARVTGRSDSATVVFLVSALFSAAAQVKITRWSRQRWTSGQAMGMGVLIAAFGWVPLMLSGPLLASAAAPANLVEALALMSPVLAGALILALGGAIANPFMMELMPVVGSERMMGTYYGYYSLMGGLAAAGGSALIGASMAFDAAALRWAPYAILMAAGLTGAAILRVMNRAGAFEPREGAA